ncbi:hypothetical protein MMC34_008305 [Xylographa carneopallida]|nr:hypothetical protein [Xylographa carneopallida]
MSTAATSGLAAASPLPARVVTPTFRPLHVSVSLGASSTTHLVAPLECVKRSPPAAIAAPFCTWSTTAQARRARSGAARVAYVGSEHLVSCRERQDVSWVVRYNVDVYALGVGVVLAVLYGVYRLLALVAGAVVAMVGVRRKSKLA